MNDVVAPENLSKCDRTLRSVAIPSLSTETGALRTLSPSPLPVGGPRRGGSAACKNRRCPAWRRLCETQARDRTGVADGHAPRLPRGARHRGPHRTSRKRLSAVVPKTLHCEIAALRAVAFVLQDDERQPCRPRCPRAVLTQVRGLRMSRQRYAAACIGGSATWSASTRWSASSWITGHAGCRRSPRVRSGIGRRRRARSDALRRGAPAGRPCARERTSPGSVRTFSPRPLPACIIAQVLYEQGQVDEAEALLVARMADIRECCTVESALRAHRLARAYCGSPRATWQGAGDAERSRNARRAARLGRDCGPRASRTRLRSKPAVGASSRPQAVCNASPNSPMNTRATSSHVRFEIARFHTVARARVALARSPSCRRSCFLAADSSRHGMARRSLCGGAGCAVARRGFAGDGATRRGDRSARSACSGLRLRSVCIKPLSIAVRASRISLTPSCNSASFRSATRANCCRMRACCSRAGNVTRAKP